MPHTHRSTAYGDIELFWLEIKNGANPYERWHEDSATPLHTAAYMGHLNIVHALVSGCKLAHIDALDGRGATPLVHAARQGQVDIVSYLLLNGADASVALAQLDNERDGETQIDQTMLLLVGEVEPYLPQALEGVPARPETAVLDTRHFRDALREDRERHSRLHKHPLIATVAERAWRCDGTRLFGCYEPSTSRGQVRFVCADGCEFSLCRMVRRVWRVSASSATHARTRSVSMAASGSSCRPRAALASTRAATGFGATTLCGRRQPSKWTMRRTL